MASIQAERLPVALGLSLRQRYEFRLSGLAVPRYEGHSHRRPVVRRSPCTRILPARLPMRAAESVSIGTSFATGLPCFVMTIPSGPNRSRIARHSCLNFAAPSVLIAVESNSGQNSVHSL